MADLQAAVETYFRQRVQAAKQRREYLGLPNKSQGLLCETALACHQPHVAVKHIAGMVGSWIIKRETIPVSPLTQFVYGLNGIAGQLVTIVHHPLL